MFPLQYKTVFATPATYRPPPDKLLRDDLDYPNLNLEDYVAVQRSALKNAKAEILDYWNSIDVNSVGQLALVTNKRDDCEWWGTFFGFDNLNVLTAQRALFGACCTELITKIRYAKDNILLVATSSGELQYWSTRPDQAVAFPLIDNGNEAYCLMKLVSVCAHSFPINQLCVSRADKSCAITMSTSHKVNVWQLDTFKPRGLSVKFTHHVTHLGCSNGITSAPQQAAVFVTCAADGRALLWDLRDTHTPSVLCANEQINWTTVDWASNDNAMENLLFLGDIDGYMRTVDVRKPKQFLDQYQALEKSWVSQILTKGSNLALIGNNPAVIKIIDTKDDDIVHVYNNAHERIYEAVWHPNEQKLITAGLGMGKKNLKIHPI